MNVQEKKEHYSILIVEDQAEDRALYKKFFEKNANPTFSVYDCDSLNKACELYDTHKPDCLLLDYHLKGFTGLELFELLKRRAPRDIVTAVFLTGDGNETLVKEIMKAGASDYIPKYDISYKRLINIIISSIREGSLRKELQAKQEALEVALRQAEEASHSKTRFFANMSHEIRTPLNAIIGFIDVLNDRSTDALDKQYLQLSRESASHLLHLINDLLDLSKLEVGKLSLEKNMFNLRKCFDIACTMCQSASTKKGIDITLNWEQNLPTHVLGDQYRLKQIVINLLSNAVKFSDENSNIIIDVYAKNRSKESFVLNCKVTDYGIGIAKDKQQLIFESFEQATQSTTREYGGTGLGLGICKHLLDLMDGEISVESTPGEGSVFSFQLPFEIARAKNTQPQEENNQSKDQKNSVNILIAEDNKINQKLVEAILKDTHYSITFAENGFEAIEQHKEGSIDLILMDINMPDCNGYRAAATIRESDKKIPIIALSAESEGECKKLVEDSGMNSFLAKPLDREKLLSTLMKHTSRS